MEELLMLIKPLVEIYGGQLGPVAQFVAFVGTARLALKPWQAIEPVIKQLIAATPTTKDDELLAKVEQSKIAKTLKFLVDYLVSIKLK